MRRQTFECLFLAACFAFAFAVQAMAEEPAQPGVIPVAQEPRHRLAFEDQHIRVFDVRIPAGDTTLYHSHQRDSIYIPISGITNLLNQEFEKAAQPLRITPGAIGFGEHSKASFSHRVSNLGDEEFHVIDVEVVAEPASSNPALGALPEGHLPALENARVRISRIFLEPGQVLDDASRAASSSLIVVLAGSRMGIAGDPAIDVAPGRFYRGAEFLSQRIRNQGNDRIELLNVEIK